MRRGFNIRNIKHKLLQNGIKGFTLFEVVIVIGIIGILLSGIIPLYFSSIKTNRYALNYSKAYKYAESKIEEYRTGDFASLAVGTTTFTVSSLPNGQGTLVVGAVDGNTTDIKKVDLTISWKDNGTKSVRLVTYIAKWGIKR